jgi:signal peptidase I
MRKSFKIMLGMVTVLAVFILISGLKVVTVVGTSMLPTYQPGEITIVIRPITGIKPGDVVLVNTDSEGSMLKRVAALPGQPIPNEYTYVVKKGLQKSPAVCPKDCVWLLGDNPKDSIDSRTYGAVPLSQIQGVVK